VVSRTDEEPEPRNHQTNGWRTGRDPVQRWLRVVTTLVCLGVFAYLSVDPDRHIDALPTIALALAAVLLLVGYESVVKLPGIGRDR
jgi:hypothetical protein